MGFSPIGFTCLKGRGNNQCGLSVTTNMKYKTVCLIIRMLECTISLSSCTLCRLLLPGNHGEMETMLRNQAVHIGVSYSSNLLGRNKISISLFKKYSCPKDFKTHLFSERIIKLTESGFHLITQINSQQRFTIGMYYKRKYVCQ